VTSSSEATATATVLIADEEPDMCGALDRLLRLSGFATVHAADAPTTLVAAEQHHVDAFIVDLKLVADAAGLEALAWLRRHPRYRLTPVFVLTGSSDSTGIDRTVIHQHWAYVFDRSEPMHVLVDYIKRVLAGMNTA
jgi:CheY-like chemotaxis protein